MLITNHFVVFLILERVLLVTIKIMVGINGSMAPLNQLVHQPTDAQADMSVQSEVTLQFSKFLTLNFILMWVD